MLEDPAGGRLLLLKSGDILLLPSNPRHVMHDASGAVPLPARNRALLNLTISENLGSDERLARIIHRGIGSVADDRSLDEREGST
jgi:AraC family transcriptional activator of mtrCDE